MRLGVAETTRGDESNVGGSAGAWLLARVDDVATGLFVALQL